MNSPIKFGLLVLFVTLLTAAVVAADSKYVSEDFEITMRTGPGNDRKILALVPSGREVQVISSGEEWSEVQLPSGKQGWVLTRYLTDKLPTAIALERLQARHAKVLAQNEALQKQVAELSGKEKELSTELADTQKDLGQLNKAHENLKSESANVLQLKNNYDKALKELKTARSKADTAESEFNRLSNNQITTGMLYGGGLLILGFIVGFIMKKPKRRSPLL